MRTLVSSLVAMAITALPGTAAAFGPQGHEAVGAIADQLLSTHAKAQLQAELGMPLRVAATWADCARDVGKQASGKFIYVANPQFHAACTAFETKAGKARMADYVSRNWRSCSDTHAEKGCHTLYHFADVAITHDDYARSEAGTSDHDIVSALDAAIAVLQGKPSPAPISVKDRQEALLMLAHLVGDVHQPLHVGSIYLDAKSKPVDPGSSTQPVDAKTSTHGGNSLETGWTNLHGEWDSVPRSLDPSKLPPAVLAAARAVPPTPGAVTAWPATWASATVKTAHQAFDGLSFTHAGATRAGDWVVKFKDHAGYEKAKADLQTRQVELAGAHLAQLLNAIWP